ncbi:MAG: dTDP-glucose 4,6-dehydratase [Planctomycetota bacterium]|jgi:dTDP-glucose 4,6-dehydratase|nr:dTDP-glucose 4,6-dehydratase [Planctomycetota bacterium]MDP6941503.1 dTDP-glucose 4,6-dehydratase [Planctomycetota bacterium]
MKPDLQGRRILITGGAGFIGGNLAHLSLQNGAERVVVYDSLTYAACPETLASIEKSDSFHFVQADVADEESFHRCLQVEKPHRVFHLAAESHVDRSLDNFTPFLHTNIHGTRSVLDATRAWVNKDAPEDFLFLHSSTDEVFGMLSKEGSFSESTPPNPRNPYSATKAAADVLVETWAHAFGIPTIISHSGNNFGPFQFPEKLIPLMIQKALRNEPLPVFGDGSQVRDWIHVHDHVRALCALAEQGKPGSRYCISSEDEHTNLDVVQTVLSCVEKSHSEIEFVTDRPGHDFRYASSNKKICEETNWSPLYTNFRKAIQETVEWYLSNPTWCRAAETQSNYHGERLGLAGYREQSEE